MKTLVCTSRNIRHSIVVQDGEEKIDSEIEAVITLYGKSMQFVGHGLVNVDFTKTVRFRLSPRAAREFSDNLRAWADEAEEEGKRLELSNKGA